MSPLVSPSSKVHFMYHYHFSGETFFILQKYQQEYSNQISVLQSMSWLMLTYISDQLYHSQKLEGKLGVLHDMHFRNKLLSGDILLSMTKSDGCHAIKIDTLKLFD